MHVDLWVAALRIFAAILAIAVFRPTWLQPWRWMAVTRRVRPLQVPSNAEEASAQP